MAGITITETATTFLQLSVGRGSLVSGAVKWTQNWSASATKQKWISSKASRKGHLHADILPLW